MENQHLLTVFIRHCEVALRYIFFSFSVCRTHKKPANFQQTTFRMLQKSGSVCCHNIQWDKLRKKEFRIFKVTSQKLFQWTLSPSNFRLDI